MSGATGISAAVASAAVPKEVRAEGAGAVRGFRAALEFESLLLKQMLSQALPESPTGTSTEGGGFGGGEEEEGGAFAAMPTVTSLPETVAEAVVGAGGLGIATEMYSNFEGVGG